MVMIDMEIKILMLNILTNIQETLTTKHNQKNKIKKIKLNNIQ